MEGDRAKLQRNTEGWGGKEGWKEEWMKGRKQGTKKERKNISDHSNFKAIQPSTYNSRMLHLQGQPRCYYSNISRAYISAAWRKFQGNHGDHWDYLNDIPLLLCWDKAVMLARNEWGRFESQEPPTELRKDDAHLTQQQDSWSSDCLCHPRWCHSQMYTLFMWISLQLVKSQ